MASIEQVKAGLAAAAQEGNGAVAQARAAAEGAGRMLAHLHTAAQGTQHPKVQEALSNAERGKQMLADAAALLEASGRAASDYVSVLG